MDSDDSVPEVDSDMETGTESGHSVPEVDPDRETGMESGHSVPEVDPDRETGTESGHSVPEVDSDGETGTESGHSVPEVGRVWEDRGVDMDREVDSGGGWARSTFFGETGPKQNSYIANIQDIAK